MAGLVADKPLNIRQVNHGIAGAIAPGISIQHEEDEPPGLPQVDETGTVVRIEHGDGSVTVSVDGRSLVDTEEQSRAGWFDNLADKIDASELSRICDDLLRGIDEDIQSRNDWIEERAQGIRLLGFKIELPNVSGATDGAPIEGMSKVRHPLLQEAVLKFQANARSEMLPVDGPVKIRDDSNGSTTAEDQLANALEKDLNHYLTVTATEYYPDTDKMFLMLGFGGTMFKKIYFCPLRNRPVSETVDANDLIVNNETTDLGNCRRATHRISMRPSTVRRMQILGVYRDIELDTAKMPQLDAAKEAALNQQGIQPSSAMRPEDRDREIYECYCELDIKDFEHKHRGKISGLEIPYRVTIDVSSRQILSLVRNYDESTKALPEARETFVKYTFVPGLGFYDIGLLHIVGNTTNAITAAWREMLDAGMFASFPGFLMSDTGARQNTNIFRVPPGGGALVKTGGLPINQAIMPLPYQPPSQALMALVDNMAQTGQRVGGTAELPVGEGKADIPVGTVLALIEQATKVLNSVHKRMHNAQAQEFRLLIRCFKEHPKSFWERNRKPTTQWNEQTFLQALNDVELTPQADPNTASYAQRVLKIMALKQLQQANPSLYDPIALDKAAIQAIGYNNPDQFMAPPSAQAAPPPELQQMQAEMAAKQADSQAKLLTAQAKVKEADAKVEHLGAGANKLNAEAQGLAGGGESGPAQQEDTGADRLNAVSNAMKAHAHLTVSQAKAQAELMNADTRAKELHLKVADTSLQDAQHTDELHAKAKENAIKMAADIMKSHAENERSHAEMTMHHGLEREKAHQDMALKAREHEAKREEFAGQREDAAEERKLKAKQTAKPKGESNGK